MNLDEIMGRVTHTRSFKLDSQNVIQSLTSLIKSTLDEVNKQTRFSNFQKLRGQERPGDFISCVQELSIIRTQNLGSQKFGAFQSYIHEIRKSHELNRTIFINSLYLHYSDMDPLFR